MYDWKLRYGQNQECEMRSGYEFATEEAARRHGENFIADVNKITVHYPNPKIEIIEV